MQLKEQVAIITGGGDVGTHAAKRFVEEGARIYRLGKPEEVAGCAVFLASEDAAWITGEVLDMNGGLYY